MITRNSLLMHLNFSRTPNIVPNRALCVAIAASVWCAGPVWAQDETPDTATQVDIQAEPGKAADTSSDTKQKQALDEIIVTATKREKSLRDIPASISAYDGEALEAEAVLSINEVLERTPGVTTNSARPGDQRIVMRGISTSSNPTSTVPYPVGIFIGDTALNEPYAASITPDLSAFDLAAVEVLKGPQGTLFGGAALSGVLRYRLNDPNPEEFQARYFSQGIYPKGGSGAWTHGVVVNVPVFGRDGNVGLRAAYIRRTYPGVTDDLRPEQAAKDVNEGKGDQIRIGLLWQPIDDLQIKYTFLRQDYKADNGLILANSPDGPRETTGSLIPWPNEHEFGLHNLEISYDWNNIRLVASSSRTEKKRFNIIDSYGALLGPALPGTPDALAIPFVTDQESTSFQQEVRLQSIAGENFEWLVGGYYLRSPIRYYLLLNAQALNDTSAALSNVLNAVRDTATNLGLGGLVDQVLDNLLPGADNLECELSVLCAETNAKAKEIAGFFDLTWRPWDQLELSAGARLYRTSVDGGFVGQGVGARLVNNGQSPADLSTSITEQGINPKFSATFHFTDNHSIYALANKGFRFGGIQNIPEDEAQNVPATYKSDFIWNYELGVRTRWLNNTLEVDVTGFYIDYTDPLVVLKNAIQINYYDNVGSAESYGIEGSLRWITPIPGIVFSASGGVVDAHTTEDFMAGRQLVPSGKPLPGSAAYQYSVKLGFFGSPDWLINVGGMVSYTYIGKTYNDISSDDLVNDYGTLDMALNLSIPTLKGQPTLSLSAVNILDTVAPVSIVNSAVGSDFFILNTPMAYTIRLSLEF